MSAGPKRAVKGTIGTRLQLSLSADMREAVEKAARKAGLSMSEWIRAAIGRAL